MTQKWIETALSQGFTHAAPLNPADLAPMESVRAMCAADKCGAYGKNWTCPPFCGTLEQCRERLHSYEAGVLLQTVGTLEKDIDTRAYARTEQLHNRLLQDFAQQLRLVYPDALCLGAGGCRICPACAWPETCRFPEKALSSMEGYGLFVTQVCRDCGIPYHYGVKTITYTACALFRRRRA